MYTWNFGFIAFVILPYVSLTMLVLGSLYRYFTNRFSWDSRSSEILRKDYSLMIGSNFFHYGILIALAGHVFGMLVPQWFYTRIGFREDWHMALSLYAGMASGMAAVIGLLLLAGRRLLRRRVRLTSQWNDIIVLLLLLAVAGLGTYNITVVRYENVLYDIAPWLRSIFLFAPAYQFLDPVPWTYKIHFIAVFFLFAFYPFSRLVHITSAPVWYLYRIWIVFRQRCAGAR